MELNNISAIIKKINRLYDIINNIGEASDTEKDLLKAYVIDLYEAVALTKDDEPVEDSTLKEMKKKLKKRKKAEKKLKQELVQEEDQTVISDPEPEVENVKEVVEENHNSNGEEAKIDLPEELIELFNFSGGGELSDRLSQAPIKDLKKALGINEKIFTINELFDGDKAEFENTLEALNGLDNFDEAKEVLIRDIANKHQWHSEKKIKKAQNFIKLVSRRYN